MNARQLVSLLNLATVVVAGTVAGTVAGCASTSGWRTLSIDGSSEQSFDASISLLKGELPDARRGMFELALGDIRHTELLNAEQQEATYTDDDFRGQLDGMSYEGVIALADQTGPSIRSMYYSRRTQRDPWAGRPWSGTDPDRFPSYVQSPPGMMNSQ
jgi:hypothetical protein